MNAVVIKSKINFIVIVCFPFFFVPSLANMESPIYINLQDWKESKTTNQFHSIVSIPGAWTKAIPCMLDVEIYEGQDRDYNPKWSSQIRPLNRS